MNAPLYSTITLGAELLVSAGIYYTLYQGYKNNKFPLFVALPALLYEIIFNISYMVSRVPSQEKVAKIESVPLLSLAIVHGTLSLIMFVSLLVFFTVAWLRYTKQINFFAKHKILTAIFTIFWTFSILSGVAFYIFLYII